jgi:hypothetical protein
MFTNPNKSDYVSWLEKKHGITCVNTGMGVSCNQIKANKKMKIERQSGHFQNALIYSVFEEDYKNMEDGTEIKIKAFGTLKQLFDY